MEQLKRYLNKYPQQFWAIIIGSLIFTLGGSMFYAYQSIYLQERLNIPLRYAALLISLRALSGVLASFFAGTVADRFGRRTLVLVSLGGGVLYYIGMKFATQVWEMAVLMLFWGIMDLCYPVGVNSMLADIIPGEDRLEAFSLLRITYNTGYAVGPIVGGILAGISYNILFDGAIFGFALSFVFMLFTLKETLDRDKVAAEKAGTGEDGSVMTALKDKPFVVSVVLMGLNYVASSCMFYMLSYFASREYGIPEAAVSVVFVVNALMCVFLQLPVIRLVRSWNPLVLMMISGLMYAIGIAAVPLFGNVFCYCLCMAVMTVGELLMTPTMTNLTAKLAPPDARGRYMSILSLAQPFGTAVGNAMHGNVYDLISPAMMWIGAACGPVVSALGFSVMNKTLGNSERFREL